MPGPSPGVGRAEFSGERRPSDQNVVINLKHDGGLQPVGMFSLAYALSFSSWREFA